MLKPVPGDYRPPGLVKEPVYYIEVEKKQASKVIEVIKNVVPPQGSTMQHIKRVKPIPGAPNLLAVLVCQTYRISESELQSTLEESLGTSIEIKYSQASQYPATSSEEANEWGKQVWPMMWRGNIKAQPPQLSDEDTEYASETIAKFQSSPDLSACCDTCWIIDPTSRKVIGSAQTSASNTHPLKHTVMEAIDSVAKQNEKSDGGYLCTGLDVFCSQEPCIMCCMGLIHSRINRLFFKHSSPSSKGPVQYYCLHGRSQLNHTFETWRCVNPALAE